MKLRLDVIEFDILPETKANITHSLDKMDVDRKVQLVNKNLTKLVEETA